MLVDNLLPSRTMAFLILALKRNPHSSTMAPPSVWLLSMVEEKVLSRLFDRDNHTSYEDFFFFSYKFRVEGPTGHFCISLMRAGLM